MARRQVVPYILSVLQTWLDEVQCEFERQPPEERVPTLPMLRDGKVNVVGIVRELSLTPADQKYFHTKPEIRGLVNEFAEAQGLRGIGSRSALDRAESEARDRFKKLSERKRDVETALTEALRQIEYLTVENEKLRIERDRCRSAINEIYRGRDLPAELVQSLNER